MNATAIARAKEAIAAGKKLECTPEKDATKKPAKATKGDTPATKAKPAAKGVSAAKAEPTKPAKKAAAPDPDTAAQKKAKAEELKRIAEEKAAAKAKEKADNAAAYKAKIEEQKAATIKRHRDEKLFNSFRARVKYMLYMDNPALGGLEGREALGWTLIHTNSAGVLLTVERVGDAVRTKVGKTIVDTCPVEEAAVLAAMGTWTA